jgi:hypothetical protein
MPGLVPHRNEHAPGILPAENRLLSPAILGMYLNSAQLAETAICWQSKELYSNLVDPGTGTLACLLD